MPNHTEWRARACASGVAQVPLRWNFQTAIGSVGLAGTAIADYRIIYGKPDLLESDIMMVENFR
jgi:hypothetical protein